MSKQEKSLYMTVLMTPEMANFAGNVHGGSLLKMLDQVAYACAARYCKGYVVTRSLDQVIFNQPVKVGELVTFMANVNYTGHSSLEVGVKVVAEDLHTAEKRHTNSCYFTMVAIGDDGAPIPAPPLTPTIPPTPMTPAGRLLQLRIREPRERQEALVEEVVR